MAAVAGIDGCRKGWVGVVLRDGRFEHATTHASFRDLLDALGPCAVAGVDMPIGILEGGVRQCEVAARTLLGPLAGTIFPMPPRSVLEAATHADALARCRDLGTPGVSAQGYALRGKVFEVEAAAASPATQLLEIHPELSFRAMAGGAVLARKRTWDGLWERDALLREHGIELPRSLPETRGAAPDDVLDAAAVAWSAQRYRRGEAVALPDPPQAGPRGATIAIWY